MRRIFPCLLALNLALASSTLAVTGKEARYIGGTVTAVAENSAGSFALGNDGILFTAGSGSLAISYDRIDSMEYGQKAGRRLGLALAVSPLFLFSKKRKHFLTINFKDESGKTQGAVFELAKGIVRQTLTTLETKSGKKVEYESEEARKHAEKR